jgi:citrate synthase
MHTIEHVIAKSLNVDVNRLTDDLQYQSIPEWDSFAHVQLMLTLEDEFGLAMTNELMLELNSLRAIKAHVRPGLAGNGQVGPNVTPGLPDKSAVHRGLNGITFDRSTITRIDADNGRLEYRGYDVNALAEHTSFEETVALLLDGELPNPDKLASIRAELASLRSVPSSILGLLAFMSDAHPMDALRTAVSALGGEHRPARNADRETARRTGLRLIAQIPTLIAAHHALRTGRVPAPPDPALPHAHDFLRMLLGTEPSDALIRLIDQDFIVHADHSSNASTFAARVAIGAGADCHAAITAAFAVFAGPLHGGAVEEVLRQTDRIGSPDKAAGFVAKQLSNNQPVMGFGHRVYRTEDPRVRHFRQTARVMGEQTGDTNAFFIVEALVEAMLPSARLGISPNVDLYAGLVYRQMSLPDDLAVAMFAAGRMPGYIAQIMEQRSNNILIRPLLQYHGAPSRAFLPMAERSSLSVATPRVEALA